MRNSHLKTKICILGNSYTAYIAYHILRNRDIDAVLVGNGNNYQTLLTNIGQDRITPIPIFPLILSDLYLYFKQYYKFPEEQLHIEYFNDGATDLNLNLIQPESLGQFMIQNKASDESLVISLKQWGSAFYNEELNEVKSKIKNHYFSGGNQSRVGFYRGNSLYYHFLRHTLNNSTLYNNIQHIDYKNKKVICERLDIFYDKLYSTINILDLYKLCGFRTSFHLKYKGSFFMYFILSPIELENNILYDCNLSSPIIRLFFPQNNILVAQLSTNSFRKYNSNSIIKRIVDILPNIKNIKYVKSIHLPFSYPLEPILDKKMINSIENIKTFSIVPFGRFGNWEYKDLHELNWTLVNDKI